MGGAFGLRAARGEPFGRGLSSAAREQPATVGGGPARTVGGVLWGPRGTRTANGRGVRPLGSGTRLEPSSADRPHLGWVYVVVAVWLPTPRRAHSVGCGVENGNKRAGTTCRDMMRRAFVRLLGSLRAATASWRPFSWPSKTRGRRGSNPTPSAIRDSTNRAALFKYTGGGSKEKIPAVTVKNA
jgi:hypothetical protein